MIRMLATMALAVWAVSGVAVAGEPGDAKLDCSVGYPKLVAVIEGLPGIAPTATPAGSPYRALMQESSYTLYTFTLPGAPGHPAIVKRRAIQDGPNVVMQESACGYGDEAGFEALKSAFKVLDGQVIKSLAK